MNKRFIIQEYVEQKSGEKIYVLKDTVLVGYFHYCFDTREAAEIQCVIFNAKRKKPNKSSNRKEPQA